jgi:streptogramin lyase
MVTTLAGSTTKGATNGPGASAKFYCPTGVAVDSHGNVYVSDEGNKLIRKITPNNMVTTLAGSVGFAGSDDGIGGAALFSWPCAIAVDSSGNVYIGDTDTHLIRKITPGGVVTTLAGSGHDGSADGTGTNASFCYPSAVAVDSQGNVYVADEGNSLIRKITPMGVVTTLAGSPGVLGSANGMGASASFNYPMGVAVDASGNVYVADTDNNLIRKITPERMVTTLAGSGLPGSENGKGIAASFAWPSGVATDSSGNIYVADTYNHQIRKITPNGVVTTLAGSGSHGFANGDNASASFCMPWGVAVDALGHVYVADSLNDMIRKIIT